MGVQDLPKKIFEKNACADPGILVRGSNFPKNFDKQKNKTPKREKGDYLVSILFHESQE